MQGSIGFEDMLLGNTGDNDFNDVTVDIEPSPTAVAFTGGEVRVALDAAIVDVDDANLSRCDRAERSAGRRPGVQRFARRYRG